MDPIVTVVEIGAVSRPIGSYGIMLSLAILVGASITVSAASRAKMDAGLVIAAFGFMAGGAALGAWLLFVAVEWVRTGTPAEALTQPGLVFFGAPLGGAIVLIPLARRWGIPLGKLADLAVPAMPAAHAMGRVGCFLGGCCFGRPWDGPWAVTYTHPIAPAAFPSVPRHPVPLYEAGLLLLLALALSLTPHRRVGGWRRLYIYLGGYGAIRMFTEAFRGDSVRGLYFDGLVSTSQIIGAVVFIGALIALYLSRPDRVAATADAV